MGSVTDAATMRVVDLCKILHSDISHRILTKLIWFSFCPYCRHWAIGYSQSNVGYGTRSGSYTAYKAPLKLHFHTNLTHSEISHHVPRHVKPMPGRRFDTGEWIYLTQWIESPVIFSKQNRSADVCRLLMRPSIVLNILCHLTNIMETAQGSTRPSFRGWPFTTFCIHSFQ